MPPEKGSWRVDPSSGRQVRLVKEGPEGQLISREQILYLLTVAKDPITLNGMIMVGLGLPMEEVMGKAASRVHRVNPAALSF